MFIAGIPHTILVRSCLNPRSDRAFGWRRHTIWLHFTEKRLSVLHYHKMSLEFVKTSMEHVIFFARESNPSPAPVSSVAHYQLVHHRRKGCTVPTCGSKIAWESYFRIIFERPFPLPTGLIFPKFISKRTTSGALKRPLQI